MNTALVPVFAGEIAGAPVQLVDARPLHAFLEVATRFNDWIRTRIEEYGFVESQDFLVTENRATKTGRGGDRRSKEYHITLDMAKELAMVERNEKGRQVRRYFIECERRLRETKPQYALKDLRSKKALPGGLTLEQQDCVKDLVKSRVDALPAEKRGGAAVTLWSALKSHFGCTYKAISPDHLTDALSLVARVDLESETRPTLPLVLTQDSTNLAGQRLLVCIADDGSSYHARSVAPDAYIMNGTQFLNALSAGDIYLQRVETHLLMDGVDYLNRTIRCRIADLQRGVVTAPA